MSKHVLNEERFWKEKKIYKICYQKNDSNICYNSAESLLFLKFKILSLVFQKETTCWQGFKLDQAKLISPNYDIIIQLVIHV